MSPPFGIVLRRERMGAGVSLTSLAKRLGVTAAYISDVERGNCGALTHDRVEAAAAALGISALRLHVAAAHTRGHVSIPMTGIEELDDALIAIAREVDAARGDPDRAAALARWLRRALRPGEGA